MTQSEWFARVCRGDEPNSLGWILDKLSDKLQILRFEFPDARPGELLALITEREERGEND